MGKLVLGALKGLVQSHTAHTQQEQDSSAHLSDVGLKPVPSPHR